MSDDNSDRSNLSRRKALAGLGGIGAATAFGGYGTLAAFSDDENVNTTVTAGELDLKLDWVSEYNGEIIADEDSDFGALSDDVTGSIQTSATDVDGEVIVNLGDVKPGDSGCTVISIHVDDNPAFVWMKADPSGSENGVTEPEAEAEVDEGYAPTGFTAEDYGPNAQSGTSGELLDAMQVNVFYDNSYDCEFNPPVNDDGSFDSSISAPEDADMTEDGDPSTGPTTPFRTLTNTGIASDKGILLDGSRGTGILSRQKAAKDTNSLWLSPFFPSPTDAVAALEVDAGYHGDPSNRQQVADNTATSAADLQNLSNGTNYAGEPGGFASHPVTGSPVNDVGTQFIAFHWEIPMSVGNEIQGDSISVSLNLAAEQARHNAKPLSPFNTGDSDADRQPDYAVDLVPQVDPADYYLNPYGI